MDRAIAEFMSWHTKEGFGHAGESTFISATPKNS